MAVRAWLSLYDEHGRFVGDRELGPREAEALALSRTALGIEFKSKGGDRYAVTGQPAPGRYLARRIA